MTSWVQVMAARRHHYVPQCYLRAFSVPRKKTHQLVAFDREVRKVFPTGTENIALERDFNRLDIEGVSSDAIEVGLSKFESDLALALQRTISGGGFQNDDDRAYVLNFVGLMALRNPRWRERRRQIREQIANTAMDLVLASKERFDSQMKRAKRDSFLAEDSDVTYEEMREAHDNGGYRIEVSREWLIETEFDGFEAILPFLFKRSWMIFRAPRDTGGFITSDHPAALVWSTAERARSGMSPGFGMRETEVAIPLSPRLALVGAFEIEEEVREVDEDAVAYFNGLMVSTCFRQVYARDHNFRYRVHPEGQSRKASKLIDDPQFIRAKN